MFVEELQFSWAGRSDQGNRGSGGMDRKKRKEEWSGLGSMS